MMKLLCLLLVVACGYAAASCPTLYKTPYNRQYLNSHPQGSCLTGYVDNIECTYTLVDYSQNRRGSRVVLRFASFNLEDNYDRLYVTYTERNTYRRVTLNYTGNRGAFTAQLQTAPNTQVTVRFHSDRSVTRNGFRLNSEVVSY